MLGRCWILLDRRAGRSPEGYPTCLRFQSESHAAWSSSGSKWGFLVNAFGSARLRKSSGCLGAQCVPKQTLDFETGRWDTEWDHSPWRTCLPPAATRPEALLRSQGCCLLSHCFSRQPVIADKITYLGFRLLLSTCPMECLEGLRC